MHEDSETVLRLGRSGKCVQGEGGVTSGIIIVVVVMDRLRGKVRQKSAWFMEK